MLAGLLGDMIGDRVGLGEIFAIGIAPDHIAVMLRHRFPEEARRRPLRRIAGQFVDPRQPDQLGHLGIGVEIGELVLALRERIEHAIIVEQPRHPEPARVPGPRVELGIAFVHPAIFAAEHFL